MPVTQSPKINKPTETTMNITETTQQKFEKLLLAQREKFAQQEAEKLRFKNKVKEYIAQGYPRIIALSYAKHGIN